MQQTAKHLTRTDVQKGHWDFDLVNKRLKICPDCKSLLDLGGNRIRMSDIFALLQSAQTITLLRAYRFALQQNEGIDLKLCITAPQGQTKWIRVTGVLSYLQWGRPEKLVGMVENITQKVAEDSMGLAVVNHELRGPLTIVKLNTQRVIRMLARKQDLETLKLLQNVDGHINGITQTLDDYLTYDPDEYRSRRNNFSVFDLNSLLQEIIQDVRTVHGTYRFTINHAGALMVRADRYKILQVMINFITNAVKFSPEASTVSVQISKKGQQTVVSVKDQGTGVPEGQEQLIFNKFHHSKDKSFKQRMSKGLGLYLVKEIIESHRGSVKAERCPTGGSVFYFTLPIYGQQEI
ncbi:sensor histidine kinase [Mucilaginibacter lutimaris]|uniref:histidine kinase n=1 Tax=Mucilaginibacter lutimaris TaxID=931629 RepID=A0ABW2ZEP0_9SPHI